MRSVWKGTIGFGAFAIPVRAHTAVTEQSTGLTQVHTTDGGRIRYRRVCEVEDAEVPASEIGRGVPTPHGDVVVLDDEDLAALTLPTTRSMRIHAFVPSGGIDPVRLGKSYYLEPEPEAVKPYALLGEALRRADRMAVVKVALRQRETLGVLRPRDRVLVLDTVHWPAELRTPDFDVPDGEAELRISQVRAAAGMIEELTTEFDADGLDDDFSRALADLVAAKVDGGAALRPAEAAQDEGVARLLRALGESVGHRDDTDPGREDHGSGDAAARAGTAAGRARGAAAKARRAAAKADAEAGDTAAARTAGRSEGTRGGTRRSGTAKRSGTGKGSNTTTQSNTTKRSGAAKQSNTAKRPGTGPRSGAAGRSAEATDADGIPAEGTAEGTGAGGRAGSRG